MNAGRTTKQGQQISSGKVHADYKATVSTMNMHPDDMKEIGVPPAAPSASGRCGAKPPSNASKARRRGMIFVPYGPPTCHLMGQYTDGTGMPTSKGWEVEVEPLEPPAAGAVAPPAREE